MGRPARGVGSTVAAVTTSVLTSLYVFGAEGRMPGDPTLHPTWLSTIGLLAGIGAAVMLCWRHRRPVLVTGIAAVPLLLAGDPVAALVALAALAASRRDRLVWVCAGAVCAATALALWRDARRAPDVSAAVQLVGARPTVGQAVGALVLAAGLTAIPLWVGVRRRTRTELARRRAVEQELRAEMARREERSRIAREMHDVLGHRLSLLSLQAGALEVNQDGVSPHAAEAARTVRTTARQSLEDLRQVIGVLNEGGGYRDRDEADARAAERPQPTLTDLPELVANARRAGLTANLTIVLDHAAAAPVPLGTATYRVVQEALTNVLRHAPGVAAEVSVQGGPGVGIAIEVVNPLPTQVPAEPSPGSGTGLTGISERVALLGGNVSAGPTDSDTFALRAWLPWTTS